MKLPEYKNWEDMVEFDKTLLSEKNILDTRLYVQLEQLAVA